MLKRVKIILLLISFSVCIGLMSNTYSRYVATTTGNIDVLFAKWQILVNNTDITSSTTSEISFVPIIDENENTASNVIAPSSKGHFDINIDPTNVDVSFKYTINLEIESENIPDLIITKYAIIPNTYVEGDPLDMVVLEENSIVNTLTFDKEEEMFEFENFTIRIFFEWYEGDGETMTDEDDTEIGKLAVTDDLTFKMKANIVFEQSI